LFCDCGDSGHLPIVVVAGCMVVVVVGCCGALKS